MFALVGNPEGQRLYALDPASGQILWGPVSTGTSWRGMVYDRGRIFGINGNGTINAFDAGSGLPVWAVGLFGFPYIFGPIPSTQNSRFYLSAAGAGSYIYDFDSFTGGMVWSRPVDGWLTSPAIGPDALYATFTVQQYYKLSLFNGAVIWHPYPYNTGPGEALSMYYQGKVYTLSDSPWFSPNSIIDSNNGQPLGSFASTIPPAFDQGLSIFVANSGRLEARDATTQSLVWAFDLPGANFSTQPVIINSNLFVGTLTGDLYALDVATGQLRWHGQVGSAIQAYPGAGPDLLVVPAGHTLVAFNSVNGPGFASDHFPGSLLDLGSTSLNLTTTYTLTISNIGRTDLIISNPLLSGPDGGSFSIDGAAYPITIPAGGPSRSLTVSCTPPVTGILSGTLGLTTNDSSMPTVNYGLKCQGQLLVVNSTDNGQGNVPGSLSYLLKSPESVGKTIKFAPQVISITLNGVENLPPLPVGTQLEGRCGVAPNSPVIISGGGRVGPGLVLGPKLPLWAGNKGFWRTSP